MTEPVAHRCAAGAGCRDAEHVDDPDTGRTIRQGANITQPHGLCGECTLNAEYAVNDIAETWLALHIAIGDRTRRQSQKVSGSPTAPININTDVDALKTAIVEWLVAAAARVSEKLNVDDPRPRNNTDRETARTVVACSRLLGPHVDTLLALDADDVMVWLDATQTAFPGERKYRDENGIEHFGVTEISMTGVDLTLRLVELRRKARKLLAITTPEEKLSLPCPHCNEKELTRSHRIINAVNGKTREIDEIDCGACGLSWPYERYRQLCLIWVKEDEMEREKLQKQLDIERERRELAEWLLAKREWQLSLALECTDVSASDFARTVLAEVPEPAADELMTDRDIAALVGVSAGTIRSWASRGQVARHTADDGSTLYWAAQVLAHAKSNTGARAGTARRLANIRKSQHGGLAADAAIG